MKAVQQDGERLDVCIRRAATRQGHGRGTDLHMDLKGGLVLGTKGMPTNYDIPWVLLKSSRSPHSLQCFQDVVLAAVSCDGLALGYLNARKNRETSLRHNGENMRKPLGKGGVYGCIPHPLHTRLHYLLLVGGWICGAGDPNARRWHMFVVLARSMANYMCLNLMCSKVHTHMVPRSFTQEQGHSFESGAALRIGQGSDWWQRSGKRGCH